MAAASPESRHDDDRVARDRTPQNRDGAADRTPEHSRPDPEGVRAAGADVGELRPSARALARLGVVLLLVAATAGVWEILASQPPQTAFHVGILVDPIAQLRRTALFLSFSLFVGAWLLPWAAPGREPFTWVLAVHVGVALTILAMLYGAATGMMGLQILDPRWDAQALFAARAVGQGILGLCLLDFARRVLFRRRSRTS